MRELAASTLAARGMSAAEYGNNARGTLGKTNWRRRPSPLPHVPATFLLSRPQPVCQRKEATLDNSDQIAGLNSITLTTDHPDTTAVLSRAAAATDRAGTAPRHGSPLGRAGRQPAFRHSPARRLLLPASAHDGHTRADTIVSFTGAIEPFEARFAAHGIAVVAKTRIGPMSFIAVRDPDGRYVCIGTPWPERKPSAP
jgi:hypothetical protein